jgi:predicted DsbA family dithiol-disulfide isomerase
VVTQLRSELGAEVDWRPFLLHPETPLDGEEFSTEKRQSLVPMINRVREMAQALGMPITFPDRMISTLRALLATEHAREQGKLFEFHRAVFHRFFGLGQDISRWDVLRAAAEDVGLNADLMQRLTESGAYNATLEKWTIKAQDLGIEDVPTYVFNDNYAVVGVQPYEVFQLVLAQMEQDSTS